MVPPHHHRPAPFRLGNAHISAFIANETDIQNPQHLYPDAKLVHGSTEVSIEMKFKNAVYPVLVSAADIPALKSIKEAGELRSYTVLEFLVDAIPKMTVSTLAVRLR